MTDSNANNDNQDRLAQLRADVERLVTEAREMAEGRTAGDMTAEELARLEEIDQLVDHYQEQITARERLGRLTATRETGNPTRRSAPSGAQDNSARTVRDRRCGFAHFGEYAQALIQDARGGADPRLAQLAATTYSSEGVGADGGYLVPPDFMDRVMSYVGDQASLYSRCQRTPANYAINWPVDENPPWSSSGPQAYWEGEAASLTASKVNVRSAGQKLNKLTALCPVTDELLDDAPQMGAYLETVIARRLRWKVDFAILQGTGVGMPLGLLNAGATKTVAKEGSQTADTVTDGNIFAMWNGVFGDFRGNAIWIANQDIETQLMTMVVAGSSSDVPVWLPAGSPFANLASAPNGTLFGRPLLYHQACETLGDKGDLFFADLSQYLIAEKTPGPQFATSIHLYFDQGLQAVRATWRLTGMPLFSTTISARDGSATYSPFCVLAERA